MYLVYFMLFTQTKMSIRYLVTKAMLYFTKFILQIFI